MGAHVPLPDLGIALYFLREGQGVSQTELGELAGISPNLLNDYEKGRKRLRRERLEYIISFMNLPPETIDDTLSTLHANRAAARPPQDGAGPRSAARRKVETVSARAGGMMRNFTRELLSLLTLEGEALQARQRAEVLFARLMRRKPEERLALVEGSGKFRTWALCERVAAESIAVAPASPDEALGLARLACRIAELVGGDPAFLRRLQGYATIHLANAWRAKQDVNRAGTTFEKGKKSWEDGAPGDPGLLDEAIVLALGAALRRDQRRFADALECLDKALAIDRGDLRGKLLLTKAQILEIRGNTAASTAVLAEAIPWVDKERDARTALGVRFQFLVNRCDEGRAAEAEPGLPQVRALAERSGKATDLTKMVWLEGKVAAGVGRLAEAEAAFRQARHELRNHKLPYDYALVSLDLALLLLEQGRTTEVRGLCAEMAWIFQAEGIAREAQAAVRLYCEAARTETVTVELTRRVVRFLHRIQHDPEARFEDGGAEGR